MTYQVLYSGPWLGIYWSTATNTDWLQKTFIETLYKRIMIHQTEQDSYLHITVKNVMCVQIVKSHEKLH
jgi:hypothetical protein